MHLVLYASGIEIDEWVDFADGFDDITEVSEWVVDSMRILNGYGILQGSIGRVMPKDLVDK